MTDRRVALAGAGLVLAGLVLWLGSGSPRGRRGDTPQAGAPAAKDQSALTPPPPALRMRKALARPAARTDAAGASHVRSDLSPRATVQATALARHDFARAVALCREDLARPNFDPREEPWCRYHLGEALFSLGRLTEAADCYSWLVAHAPDHPASANAREALKYIQDLPRYRPRLAQLARAGGRGR